MTHTIFRTLRRALAWSLPLAVTAGIVALSLDLQKPAASQGLPIGKNKPLALDPSGPLVVSLTAGTQELGTFSEISIVSEIELLDLSQQEFDEPILKRFQGKPKPATITLRRLLPPKDTGVAQWHRMARMGNLRALRDCTLIVSNGGTVVRYMLTNAWPSKLEVDTVAPALVETVVLTADEVLLAP